MKFGISGCLVGPTFVASWEGFKTHSPKSSLLIHTTPCKSVIHVFLLCLFSPISSKKNLSREDIVVVPKQRTPRTVFWDFFGFAVNKKSHGTNRSEMQEYHPRNKKEALGFFCADTVDAVWKERRVFLEMCFLALQWKRTKKNTSRDLFNWDLSRGVLECSWKLLYVDPWDDGIYIYI